MVSSLENGSYLTFSNRVRICVALGEPNNPSSNFVSRLTARMCYSKQRIRSGMMSWDPGLEFTEVHVYQSFAAVSAVPEQFFLFAM